MAGYFDFERNEPCPCGSGRKYKKCCRNTVEDYYMSWREKDWSLMEPPFAQALAALCGLRPDRDERVPGVEEVEEALSYIEDNFFQKEKEEDLVAFLSGMANEFMRLLKEDEYFRHIRLSLDEAVDLSEHLDEHVSELGQDPDREAFENVFEAVMTEWLEKMGEEENGDLAWKIFFGLRQKGYALRERAALLFALKLFSEKIRTATNPFWEAVVRVSIFEAWKGMEELEKFRENEGKVTMEEILEKYPIIKKDISQRHYIKLLPAIGLILTGRLEFKLPAYAVLGGILKAVEHQAKRVLEEGKSDFPAEDLSEKLKDLSPDDELNRLLVETAWDIDYEIFVDTAVTFLDNWLHNEGKDETEEVREAVKVLKESFGDSLVDSSATVYFMHYVLCLAHAFGRREASLPVLGDEKGPGIAWEQIYTPEGLEAYARYLEKMGKPEAAEHVRRVKEEVLLNKVQP
ncbi:SEC-C domain-containing protein [Calderihabitans maritimus]|uniref:SEC-C domain-containing protein n=1 Tax=Calderihabitans maritimus TaxID=1246530 RepID=UPI001864F77C|nr:SEC-C domain-containing protein [Calderihabitans maritimus]